MALVVGDPPVVSRSTTTKVTSASGVPRSSNDVCWATPDLKLAARGSWAIDRAHTETVGAAATDKAGNLARGPSARRIVENPQSARHATIGRLRRPLAPPTAGTVEPSGSSTGAVAGRPGRHPLADLPGQQPGDRQRDAIPMPKAMHQQYAPPRPSDGRRAQQYQQRRDGLGTTPPATPRAISVARAGARGWDGRPGDGWLAITAVADVGEDGRAVAMAVVVGSGRGMVVGMVMVRVPR